MSESTNKMVILINKNVELKLIQCCHNIPVLTITMILKTMIINVMLGQFPFIIFYVVYLNVHIHTLFDLFVNFFVVKLNPVLFIY